MSTPTDPPRDELRALRQRAYGPDADIHDDPVALARLHELENAARPSAVAPVASASAPPPEEATDASPLTDAANSTATEAEPSPAVADPAPIADDQSAGAAPEDGIPDSPNTTDESTDAPARRPWWRRRIPVLWAGSLAGVALLAGVGLTLGVQALDSGQVAVLSVDEEADWPSQMFGSQPPGSLVFEDFHGLTVLAFSQGFGPGDMQDCLYITTADQGVGASGCGPDAFPATASLQVLSVSPVKLRDAFEPGTALRFVLDGDQVRVYARGPVVVRPTP